MTQAFVETASGLLMDKEGRILLGLRAAWKRVWPEAWDAIGGHVEPGEGLDDALVRELREEVGVTATAFHKIAALPEPRPDLYGEAVHHVYVVTAWEGEATNACDEHSEVRWFTRAQAAALTNTTGLDFPALFAMADAR
jgi:8-oxo-dGTP diphosphatase